MGKANTNLKYLNSIEIRIQWTNEIQDENGSLSFINIQITQQTTGFSTAVYRKPTYTKSYCKFKSNNQIKPS